MLATWLLKNALGLSEACSGCFCKRGSKETWGGGHQPMGLNTGVAKRKREARWVPSVLSLSGSWSSLIWTSNPIFPLPYHIRPRAFIMGCTLELSVKIIPFSLQLLLVNIWSCQWEKVLIHVYLIRIWVFPTMLLYQLWFFLEPH